MQSFSENILFYGNNIFITLSTIFITYKQNMHGYALHVTIVYKYTFLRYYCFQYIIGNLYMFKTDHASMCSACTHFLHTCLFTVILFSVKLSETVDYNQYMHQFALPVTIFYKKYLFTAILFPVTLPITFIAYKQNMQRCAPLGMYPFSTKTLVCGSTIFSKTITKLYH